MIERSRWELREQLKEHLGMEATNALLDELPDAGALATKSDIADVRTAIADLRGSLLTALLGAVLAMYTATLGAVVALVALT